MSAPQVTININYPGSGSIASYFDVQITAAGSTLLPLDVLMGWCVDTSYSVNTPQQYTASVYSSLETSTLSTDLPWLGANATTNLQQSMEQVNWILNQNYEAQLAADGQNYTFGDIELALWTMLGDTVSADNYLSLGGYTQSHVDKIIADSAAGIGFVPSTNQYIGLIFAPVDANGNTMQPIIAPILAGAITGFTWLDTNVNGLQDTTEAGVDNILVSLGRDLNGDGVLESNEILTQTISGDNPNTPAVEHGYYAFNGLAPGLEYQVEFQKPNGLSFTQAYQGNGTNDSAASATGDTASIVLSPGQTNQTLNAGFYQNTTIGDRVWEDSNGNGLQDTGEQGISGVTVDLLDANGNVINTVTTNSTGNYSFSVAPGTYSVALLPPNGFLPTAANQGANNAINSRGVAGTVAGAAAVVSAPITVSNGQAVSNDDFGLYKTGSIGDRVWLDTNGNGLQDAGETGVQGVKVSLLDVKGNIIGSPVVTDVNGNYLFAGLAPGVYSLKFDKTSLPAGYSFTSALQGANTALDSNANPADGTTGMITLSSRQNDLSWDAGIVGNPAPPAPTVTISTDANNDGWINKAELGAATTIAVQISVPVGAIVGDKLTVTNGTTPQAHVLTAADLSAGFWATTFAKPAEGATLTISATITNQANATSAAGTDTVVLDTTATAAPVVTITTDANNDAAISLAELGTATSIAVTVTLPTGTLAGNTITVTNGVTPQTHLVTAADISAGKWLTSFAVPAAGTTLTVTATVTDAAGNTSVAGTDKALMNTAVTAAPTVTITTDTNNDGWINKTEIGSATTIAVKIGLPSGAKAGDTLTVSNGTTTTNRVLTSTDITANSWSTTFTKPAEGASVTVTATLKNSLGNVSSAGSDTAILDTTATSAPIVTITTDANNDGKITAAELAGATTVAVQVSLPTGSKAGDSVSVTDGITPQTHVLTTADITAGKWLTSFAKPAEGATLTVTGKLIDAAGNASTSSSDSAMINAFTTAAPKITITTDTNNDGKINLTELGSATLIAVQVGVPVGAKAGDTLTVSDGISPQSHILTSTDITVGSWTTSFAKPAEGATITVTGTLTTAAGNTSAAGSDSALLDTTATAAPVVTIVPDINNDDEITAVELGSATGIAVKTSIPVGALVGDILTITDGINPQTHVITAADLVTGYWLTSFANPGDGVALSMTATVTDTAGNISAAGGDWAMLAMATPGSLSGSVYLDANNNGIRDAGETGFAGQILYLNGTDVQNFNVYAQATTDANGNYSFTGLVPGTYNITADTIQNYGNGQDSAGNSNGTVSTNYTYDINLGAGQNFTGISFAELPPTTVHNSSMSGSVYVDANNNGIRDAGEVGIAGVKIELSGTDANNNSVYQTVNTDANGNYSFTSLMAGRYGIIETQPTNTPYVDGKDSAGNSGGLVYNDYVYVSNLTAGQVATGITFGEHLPLPAVVTQVFPMSSNEGDYIQTPIFLQSTGEPTTVNITVQSGTAIMGQDFSGTIEALINGVWQTVTGNSFIAPAGSLWVDVRIATINDTLVEGNEYFTITANGVTGTQTIIDNDFSTSSPLVLDLNGDGVQTTSITNGTTFDLLASGQAVNTGWVSKQDALLAIDLNGNGKIDSGAELFGQATKLADGTTAKDGFQALAAQDSNHDGIISAADANFSKLLIWQDANGDGVSQPGEMHSLSSLGIASLNLAATAGDTVQNGNTLGLLSSYTTTDGQTHQMADVWFQYQPATSATVSAPVPSAAEVLGHGVNMDKLLANVPAAPAVASPFEAASSSEAATVDTSSLQLLHHLDDYAAHLAHVA